MLRVKDLVVRYGPVPAVHGITVNVDKGELVGVIGPNGAGKSTTLLTIMGMLRPAKGTITFEDKSIIGEPPERVARRGIALVPEGRHIFATLTVEENLILGTAGRADLGTAQEDFEEVLGRFPVLERYLKSNAGNLSGGEQQQLAIARALLARPRLLLLDEPSLGLAPRLVDEVFTLLDGLRKDGVTILLVEQNAKRTVQLADRIYILRSGRVELSGTREELMRRTDLHDVYFGVQLPAGTDNVDNDHTE